MAGTGSRRRLVSVLASVAAVLAGGATAVLVDAGHRNGDWTAFAFSWTSLAVAVAAYAACRIELLHTMTGIGVGASLVLIVALGAIAAANFLAIGRLARTAK